MSGHPGIVAVREFFASEGEDKYFPVSYTHLDVYKRQDKGTCRVELIDFDAASGTKEAA